MAELQSLAQHHGLALVEDARKRSGPFAVENRSDSSDGWLLQFLSNQESWPAGTAAWW